jgi:hypothetical protein
LASGAPCEEARQSEIKRGDLPVKHSFLSTEAVMAQSEATRGDKCRFFWADRLYAAAVTAWIVAVWGGAYYLARAAISDESAGVGGNSFLLACSLVTAGVITAFSVRELIVACRRLNGGRNRDRRTRP